MSCIESPALWLHTLKAIAKAAGDSEVDATCNDNHARIAAALSSAEHGLIALGAQALNHPQAAALRYWVARIAELTSCVAGSIPSASNSIGASLAGMLPHLGAGGASCIAGLNVQQMFDQPRKAYLLHGIEAQLDCAHPNATSALAAAELVVSLSAFHSAELRANSNALLPIALFAESDGTYVNAEGRWQSAGAAVVAPEQARPAWKILRVLANQLDVAGFDYMRIDSVTQELRAVVADTAVAGIAKRDAPMTGASVTEAQGDGALWRCAETPIYSVDALVRRSKPLQRTPLAAAAKASINSSEAARQGLSSSAVVRVFQGDASVELELEFDDSVADGCICVPAALAQTAPLGGSSGAVSVEAVAAAMEA